MRADEISIPTPCDEDWDAMDREERGRYCHRCARSVHDLSAMTEPEARALLDAAEVGERLCISMVVRGDRVVHSDDPIPPPSLLRLTSARLPRFAPSALAGALALLGAHGCTPHGQPDALEVTDAEETGPDLGRAVVIPTVDGPPPAPVGDTPCEPEVNEPERRPRPRVKGERVRRKQGDVSEADPDLHIVGWGT